MLAGRGACRLPAGASGRLISPPRAPLPPPAPALGRARPLARLQATARPRRREPCRQVGVRHRARPAAVPRQERADRATAAPAAEHRTEADWWSRPSSMATWGPAWRVVPVALRSAGRSREWPAYRPTAPRSAQVTWQNFNVYDYTGKLLSSVPLANLITNAGLNPKSTQGFPFEPHVLYDEFIGRWLLTSTCLYDCFLVSSTSDATGTWSSICMVNHNGSDPGMHLGYDVNGAYLSEAGTGTDSNTATYSYTFFSIPAAELQWTTSLAPTHLNISLNTPRSIGMPICRSQCREGNASDPAFFVVKSCPSGSCQNGTNFSFDWIVTTVTWSGTTASYSADQLVPTAVGSAQNHWLFNTELNGPQSGSRSSDSRRRIASGHGLDPGGHPSRSRFAFGSLLAANCGTQRGGRQRSPVLGRPRLLDPECLRRRADHRRSQSPTESYVFASRLASTGMANVGIAAAAMGATINPSVRA